MPKRKKTSQILKQRASREPGGIFKRIFRWFFWLIFLSALIGAAGIAGIFFYLAEGLPRISSLADYRPPVVTTVYSDDERKIAEFYRERRIVLPLPEVPKMLIEAFIAAEDSRFYQHKGVDILSIIRAFFKNLEAGSIVQGGSTITQQVTKSFLLTPERSYTRKIKEAILAYRIEKTFSKQEVLYLYLNQIYLGHGAYGVAAAAENYFGKSVKDMNLAECAMLAGLPQAPSRYSPFRHPERAKQRQIYALNRMVEEGYITKVQATEAIDTPLDVKPRRNWYIEKVPIYTEHVRREIERMFGKDTLYEEGLKIYTAVNIEMQKAARAEIDIGLRDLDKRQGYRGPLKHLSPEEIEEVAQNLQTGEEPPLLDIGRIVTGIVIDVNDTTDTVTVRLGPVLGSLKLADMRWARKPNPDVAWYEARVRHPGQVLSVGDVIDVRIKGKPEKSDMVDLSLEQAPEVQAALLCIESATGQVKVMVGGRDFKESKFNRAIQSRRQPGSAFKPVIYSAALDKGFTPASVIIDSPIVFLDTQRDHTWKPRNYGRKFYGPTLLREALAKSRNVVTVKVLQAIGIDYTIDYARKLGISSHISNNLSIALGSSGLSLLELVAAYSVFANQGYLISPVFITRIVDRSGKVIYEANPERKKVIEESTAYIMTSLLQSVVQNGTGRRVRALKRPVAGKTGTTNDLFDAWFVGFTPEYVTGTWVGLDDEGPLGKGETGSRAASPIWLGFMKKILEDKPVKVFQVPEGVVFSKIDAETGLLPVPETRKTLFECFKEGTVPTRYTKRPQKEADPEDFYKTVM